MIINIHSLFPLVGGFCACFYFCSNDNESRVLLKKVTTSQKGPLLFPHHKSDMTLADKPISSIEKITLRILKRKKHFFFPWVSQAAVALSLAGSVRAERPAVQESSEPWLLPVEAPDVSMSLLPWGSFVWQREREKSIYGGCWEPPGDLCLYVCLLTLHENSPGTFGSCCSYCSNIAAALFAVTVQHQ